MRERRRAVDNLGLGGYGGHAQFDTASGAEEGEPPDEEGLISRAEHAG